MTLSRFATRLNSFASAPQLFWPDLTGKPTMMQMAERAATVQGLTDLDLNFPDHVADEPEAIARRIGDLGLSINGLAMRYYTNPAFKLGAFTNPDKSVRQEAIDLTKRGIDAARAMGTRPDDDLARPGRLRLQFPARLRPGLGLGGRRHPRRRRTRSGLPDQHRVQAGRAARLQPAAGRRHDAARHCTRPARPTSA